MPKQINAFDTLKIAGFFQPCFWRVLKYPDPKTFSNLFFKDDVSVSPYKKMSQAYDLNIAFISSSWSIYLHSD